MRKTFFPILILLCILSLLGCEKNTKEKKGTPKPDEGVVYEPGVDFTGVIKKVDKENEFIEFYNTTFEGVESYPYTLATNILTKNEKEMSVSELEVGDVYDVYTSKDGSKILKLVESNAKKNEGVTLSVDSEKKMITIRDVNYRYTDNLVVLSEGRQITPMEITSQDRVTFRGVKGKAFSIVVTQGHGYIEPTNFKDFYGGTVTIEGESILPISKDMLLTVPEGTQKLSMKNGDLMGMVSVKVKRNQVTKVDMAKYQNQVPDTGRVRFNISPQGAELYINGALTDYSKAVPLKYGNHNIKVVLEGYNDYSGMLKVSDAAPVVNINLAKETAEVEDNNESDSKVEDKSDDSTSNTSTDSDHKIKVSAPKGVSVYLDGKYQGEAPCEFEKTIGDVTITLSKEGYTTKSYSLKISDDGQDVSWSFPDLTKK